jgi:hypothetical protein
MGLQWVFKQGLRGPIPENDKLFFTGPKLFRMITLQGLADFSFR